MALVLWELSHVRFLECWTWRVLEVANLDRNRKFERHQIVESSFSPVYVQRTRFRGPYKVVSFIWLHSRVWESGIWLWEIIQVVKVRWNVEVGYDFYVGYSKSWGLMCSKVFWGIIYQGGLEDCISLSGLELDVLGIELSLLEINQNIDCLYVYLNFRQLVTHRYNISSWDAWIDYFFEESRHRLIFINPPRRCTEHMWRQN